jgi:tRNA(Arg) A34 adenosine deaminase TadA
MCSQKPALTEQKPAATELLCGPTQPPMYVPSPRHTGDFKQDLEAEWERVNEEMRANWSAETQRLCESERQKVFFRAFHLTLNPSRSSLDKYRFGRKFSLEEKWRHRIYSFGLMRILHNEYNGNKCGPAGTYPYREGQRNHANELYVGSESQDIDYKGHNIAALAVNEFGEVITSAFNHNKVFASTAEHAEMRLLDECFRSPALHFDRAECGCIQSEKLEIEDKMQQVTVYTSLEPCQQCSGRLLLASVPEVVYLQRDPDIMLQALMTYQKDFRTRPVPAVLFDFDAYDEFEDRYWTLKRAGFENLDKFWKPPPDSGMRAKSFGQSMPYFLCTDKAKAIIDKASDDFENLFTDRDENFSKLTAEDKDRVLNFRPKANAAQRRNWENELWQTRMNLLNHEYEQRKEILIEGLDVNWREEEVASAIAGVDGASDAVSISVPRLAGMKGQTTGRAFVQFATAKAAEDAGVALCIQGYDAKASVNLPHFRTIMKNIAKLEKKLEEADKERAEDSRVLSNREALSKVREYVEYERKCERRGTMHR